MPNVTIAGALRLAINVLRDAAESRKMPSGVGPADLHTDTAETLEVSLAELRDHE